MSEKGKNRTNEYKIFCEPIINVFEGEYITGILTKTNQFVQINPPIKEEELDETNSRFRNPNWINEGYK